MTAVSDYLEDKWLDHVLRNTPYTSPGTSIYVALYTSDPTDADVGNEASGGSYARQQVTAWTVSGVGLRKNTNAIQYPVATGDWGTLTHVGIHDHVSAGNLLFHGPLDTQQAVVIGNQFEFLAEQLAVSAN